MSEIISYSELFKWDTCHRQYYYGFVLGLQPVEQSQAITTGVKGHQLLQSFYTLMQEGKAKEEAHKLTLVSAQKLLKSEGFADFSLLKSWTLVDNYIRDNDFTSEAVLVENRFLIPVAKIAPASFIDAYGLHDVQIGFTPDVVFKRPGGIYDVEDSKFVARAWSKSKLNRFQQAKLYQVLLRRMGYNVSRSAVRFFNVQTGIINVQNYPLTEAEEKTIIHDFTNGIKDVIQYRNQTPNTLSMARRTMNYTACQFCPFEFPCTLEAEGKDASKTFNNEYVKSDYNYSR